MSVYIIQDRHEPWNRYAATRATERDARELVRELEDFDRDDGVYEPDRYTVKKRAYCYNDYAEKCGYGHLGICMLENPDIDCPLVRKRAAAMAADTR